MFSGEVCQIFKDIFFTEHIKTTPSVLPRKIIVNKFLLSKVWKAFKFGEKELHHSSIKLTLDHCKYFHCFSDFNPASDDWYEVIQDYKDKKISRIDINEFAAIYEEESHRKTASFKELVEGLKCIDPMNGENGKNRNFSMQLLYTVIWKFENLWNFQNRYYLEHTLNTFRKTSEWLLS